MSQEIVGLEKKVSGGEEELVEGGGEESSLKEIVEQVGEEKEVDGQDDSAPNKELDDKGEGEVLKDLVKGWKTWKMRARIMGNKSILLTPLGPTKRSVEGGQVEDHEVKFLKKQGRKLEGKEHVEQEELAVAVKQPRQVL